MSDESGREPDEKDPGYEGVRDFLLFGMSLPERALRTASGVLGGALRESASLLVPQAFQDSKTYHVMIRQTLDFLAEDVGGVEHSEDPNAPAKVENFVARKAVGNFIEMAGLATFHLSPLMLLAVVSDVVYGSQAYLKEVADDLKQQGVIAEDSTINHVDDLLNAVAHAAGTTASAFDTPPLSVDGLKQTINETRRSVGAIDPTKVIPQAEVQRLWEEIHETATSQGVNPFAVSSAMTLYSLDKIGVLGRGALSTVKAAGTLLDRHVIDHYSSALGEIRGKGIYASLQETSRPYIDAVWMNFSTDKTTITEDVVSGKLIGQAWTAARRWLGGR
ncbi:MAG: hypothetical protein A2V70_00430 [Planctomycetes bacterium RBG_13_63_9]|nr:MAG: hypothetical protein A2V70_00430 [Planctomycetes bacterium RBG_13_63_9]